MSIGKVMSFAIIYIKIDVVVWNKQLCICFYKIVANSKREIMLLHIHVLIWCSGGYSCFLGCSCIITNYVWCLLGWFYHSNSLCIVGCAEADGALDKARKHKKRQLQDTLNLVLKKRKVRTYYMFFLLG